MGRIMETIGSQARTLQPNASIMGYYMKLTLILAVDRTKHGHHDTKQRSRGTRQSLVRVAVLGSNGVTSA